MSEADRGEVVRPRFFVTTCQRPSPACLHQAQEIAAAYALPFLPRRSATLAALCRASGLKAVLVVSDAEMRYVTPEATLRFHPSMAKVRWHNLQKGRGDPLVSAMGLHPGDRVFDCTLGLGSDAIVCSLVTGEKGLVHGVESVLPIYLVVSHGLQHYQAKRAELSAAMRRIETDWQEASHALSGLQRGDYEVIYCDPFFERPVEASSAIAPLRLIGERRLDNLKRAIRQAINLAGRCVVIKGRRGTSLWEELPITRLCSGRASNVEYAVIETGK